VTPEVTAIAEDLYRYLRSVGGVSEVHRPVPIRKKPAPRGRPPVPAFMAAPEAAFEISFVYKYEARIFRYYVDARDDLRAVTETLRSHTNGELMVRVPGGYGDVLPNDIHYVNRLNLAPGTLAPLR
jgi:hypothetical protein